MMKYVYLFVIFMTQNCHYKIVYQLYTSIIFKKIYLISARRKLSFVDIVLSAKERISRTALSLDKYDDVLNSLKDMKVSSRINNVNMPAEERMNTQMTLNYDT